METKALRIRNVCFWAMVVIFAVLVAGVARRWMFWGHRMPEAGFAAIAIIFCALAITLLVLSLKLKDPLMQKIFFILTGASAAAIPVCAILHNVVYGLFYVGKGGDEAFFFILAVIVCPILFAVGMLGSIATQIFGRLRKKNIAC